MSVNRKGILWQRKRKIVEKQKEIVSRVEKQITEREEMTKQLMQSIMKDAFNKYSSASGYLNDTFLNSTVPISLVLPSKLPS